MFRNKLNLNVISRLNKNKPILELTKQQQRHRVNDRELSLSVSPTCLEHIVRKQLDQFAEALTSFFSANNLTVASFDDVLICGELQSRLRVPAEDVHQHGSRNRFDSP